MEKIDLKDRKILYLLDINARQTLTQIGRKVGLSKGVVKYRIENLSKKGIIKSYYTVIDSSKLGYSCFRFYVSFKNTTPAIERDIINYFVKNKFTWWVCSLMGRYNLSVTIWIKNISDFNKFWDNTLYKYHDYFDNQVISVYLQLFYYRHSFLLDDKYSKADRKKFEIEGCGEKVDIDDLDCKILRKIASSARIPLNEIAEELDASASTINNRIRKLVNLGVIQGFRVLFDYMKLGYYLYKVDIGLKDYKKRRKIIDYIILNPHLRFLSKTAGYSDLELGFIVEDVTKIESIMNDLIVKFPDTIRGYTYFYESKIHKMKFIPEV